MTAQAGTTRAREVTTPRTSAKVRGPCAAAEHICANNCITVRGVGWHIELPPKDQLVFLAGLGLLALGGLMSWPVALAVAVGHDLARSRHSRALREFGQALEDA